MIQQIKVIVENYLNARALAKIMYGTYQDAGVMVGKDLIPIDLIHVPGWLQVNVIETEEDAGHCHKFQQNVVLEVGDQVCMLRDDRAKNYIVLDVMKE